MTAPATPFPRDLVAQVVAVIEATRVDLSLEDRAQEALADALLRAFHPMPVEREVVLGPGERIDIMVGPVGVEVKRNSAGRKATLRQLGRYAGHSRVEGLVLASNRAMRLVPEIAGKPLAFASLGRAWL